MLRHLDPSDNSSTERLELTNSCETSLKRSEERIECVTLSHLIHAADIRNICLAHRRVGEGQEQAYTQVAASNEYKLRPARAD